MELLIVSGLSGAGKSVAMNALEDIGFFCIDNVPAGLLPSITAFSKAGDNQLERVALSMDALLRSFPVEQIGAAVQWPAQQLLYKKHKKEAAAQKCATASHNSGYAIEQCSGTGDHRAAFAASICLISSGTTLNRSPTMP